MGNLNALTTAIRDLNEEMARNLAGVGDTATLEAFRVEYLGRKGRVSQLFKALGDLSAEDKSEAGRLLNELRDGITRAFDEASERTGSRGVD